MLHLFLWGVAYFIGVKPIPLGGAPAAGTGDCPVKFCENSEANSTGARPAVPRKIPARLNFERTSGADL